MYDRTVTSIINWEIFNKLFYCTVVVNFELVVFPIPSWDGRLEKIFSNNVVEIDVSFNMN